jgi:hypothetical protein
MANSINVATAAAGKVAVLTAIHVPSVGTKFASTPGYAR